MIEPFNAKELAELLRGLEQRNIPYELEHRRVAGDCNGIVVRISAASKIWEVGFYDNYHIELLKYALAGDAQTGVTAASVLSDWDSGK
jgi:hypothetical protein